MKTFRSFATWAAPASLLACVLAFSACRTTPEAPRLPQFDPGVDALVNPTQPGDFKSVARGQKLYQTYCITCHGPAGLGDGPVSMASPAPLKGPFAGVFPLVTAMGRSDGYIYNLIRGGGQRMPSYARIAPEDRWHLVNYVRYLQRGGRP